MNISYEEIGQVLVTCPVAESVTEGDVVKLDGDGKAAPCQAGDRFCGQAVGVAEDGCAAIQLGGFVTLACKDAAVAPGWAALTGDGSGGVKKAGDGDESESLLVMEADGAYAVVRL